MHESHDAFVVAGWALGTQRDRANTHISQEDRLALCTLEWLAPSPELQTRYKGQNNE